MFTTLNINLSDAQGKITLELVVVSGRNLNSSKLLCMSFLPARIRMIESKMNELKCSQHFPIISIWDFSRAAYSAVLCRICPNFKHDRDVINIFVTCKYEEDLLKNKGARVFTTFPPLYPYGSYRLPWKPEF